MAEKVLDVLDLFSGIGGFSLGLERTGGFKTVGFCECDPFCQKVLKKHWPHVPIYEDVRTLSGITANVVTGGYPCQPFSAAGKRGGEEDDRHLWPAMFGIIKAIRPEWVIAENVAGHISMGLDAVLSDLESAGYTWWTFVIPACAVDARHRRDRVWIIAHAKRDASNERHEFSVLGRREREAEQVGVGGLEAFANASSVGWERRDSRRRITERENESSARCETGGSIQQDAIANTVGWQRPQRGEAGRMGREEQVSRVRVGQITSEPLVCRGTHGIPNRVDRLKALGNSVVPQIPEMIGYAILEAMQHG